MKKQTFFTALSLAMLFFLGFAGCQKDDTASTAELSTTTPLLAKGTVPPVMTEPRCDCEYQIVSETHTTPPSGYQFAYDVLTTENCVSTLNCRYFRYVEGCDFEGYDPCADYVSAGISKPTQWFPFNCQQVFYSTFYVTVDHSLFWNSTCTVPYDNGDPEGEIVVRVRCKGGDTDGECSTTWQTSDDVPLPYHDGAFSYNLTEPPFDLEGCGCTPVVTMPY